MKNTMKKPKLFILLLLACVIGFGIWDGRFNDNNTAAVEKDKSNRLANGINLSSIQSTPWDVKTASSRVNKQSKKPYTIMIFMNGSDLESENGAATNDLIEMLDSGVNTDQVNIVLFTGGANRWQNDVVPDNNCMLWKITDGDLEELAGVGLVNMGNPGTLSSFIDFSIENFPAEKYGLIMWDHGGGSIAGYGHDENFDNSNLTLLDMNYAFENSKLRENKLEFLGFDSCLMATVEMAVVASDYAGYLVASEDLEPGDGWDYNFLSLLNDTPSMDGATLGVNIADYFMDYYGTGSDDILTISVIDLSNVGQVMEAMGNLMNLCSANLSTEKAPSFETFSKKRYRTKTFGAGTPRDSDCDMVDIGDMAAKLSDLFPEETATVLSALEKSVLYNRHNSDTDLKGLSAYYIYGGKDFANLSLSTYASLNMNSNYTEYLYDFAAILNSSSKNSRGTRSRSSDQKNDTDKVWPLTEELVSADLTVWQSVEGKQGFFIMTGIQKDKDIDASETWTKDHDALWPKIDGKYVCLYEISHSETLAGQSLYAIPAVLNGRDCDIIVLFSQHYPDGKILGARQEDGFIIQKGFDRFEDGDTLSFYYQERYFGDATNDIESNWLKSDELTVEGELKLDWSKMVGDEVYYSLLLTDVRCNEYFTDLKQ